LKSKVLDFRQAARQARAIKGNRSLSRWTRVRKATQAVSRSLGLRRPPAVLLYQGAFDPVHRGHLANLKSALTGVKDVGHVYVVPTSSHPGKKPVAHRHRVAMMERALDANRGIPSGVAVSVVKEPRLARLSMDGFKDLTAMIHASHPGARVYIMTGSDAFDRAREGGLVGRALRWGYRYAVTPRDGHPISSKLPTGVEVMPISGGGVSSTKIRNALKEQKVPWSGLPGPAARYIVERGLYGLGHGGGGR
jgi:cytidyltransferase-like protein